MKEIIATASSAQYQQQFTGCIFNGRITDADCQYGQPLFLA